MKRLLYVQAQPYLHAKEGVEQNQLDLFAPTKASARGLGRSKRSLQDFAIQRLALQGIAIASSLDAQRTLRNAIDQTLNIQDVEGTARAWMPTVRSLLRSSLTLKSTNCSERATQLIAVTQRYQALLQQQHQVDAAGVLWRAVERQPEKRSVLIYGYFQPCLDELALIDAIAGDGSSIYLPILNDTIFSQCRIAVKWLQQQGWEIDPSESSPHSIGEHLGHQFLVATNAPEKPVTHKYSTAEAEVRGTLAQVKQLLHEGVSARDIAIIARDEVSYGPKLLEIAWEFDVPLRALYSTPLNTTRFGAWINLLLEVIEQRFPFEATAKLLSHPLCTNPDAEFWSIVRSRPLVGFMAWQEVCQQVLNLDLTVLKFGNRARRDTWVATIQTILKTFDLRRRCSRWARESLAFNELDQGLVNLAKPEDEILSWEAFAQELRELVAIAGVPAQPGRGGVELHNPTSVIGARYPYLFVVGMAEGILPAPVRNDCVLDFYERKALRPIGIHLELSVEAARKEALLFYYLLQTVTKSIVFSYATLNGREEHLPSPYLAQLGIKAITPSASPVASEEELRRITLRQKTSAEDSVIHNAAHAWSVERRRESCNPHDEYDGVTGIPIDYRDRTFSVSQLTYLGLCPFKWFAGKGLNLSEPNNDETDLSPSRRGSLYHSVLELMVKEIQTNPQRALTDPELLEAKFQIVEQKMQLTVLPIWAAQRVEHIQTLTRVLNQTDFLPDDAMAIAIEAKFKGTWHDLNLMGRVDRIDRTSKGLTLIDYKTGSQPPAGVKDAEGKPKLDLQLSIYKAVAAPQLFPDLPNNSVVSAHYYSLSKAKKLSRKLPTEQELLAFADRCKSHLQTGSFPVMPDSVHKTSDQREACKYCTFDLVCRQGNRLNRKLSKESNNGAD